MVMHKVFRCTAHVKLFSENIVRQIAENLGRVIVDRGRTVFAVLHARSMDFPAMAVRAVTVTEARVK